MSCDNRPPPRQARATQRSAASSLLPSLNATASSTQAGTKAGFGDLDETDAIPSVSGTVPIATHHVVVTVKGDTKQLDIRTNTSAQIYGRASAAASSTLVYIATRGWRDRRGR